MTALLGIDDGITSGNYDAADWAFLVGLIFAGLAAIIYALPPRAPQALDEHPRTYIRWAPALVSAAVALAALGLMLL